MVEGGGATSYAGVRVYVLFAARRLADAVVERAAKRFRQTAKYTNREIGGEIVDLDADDRLAKSLAASEQGRQLFERIESSVPVICVSSSFIGNPATTEQVELLRFSDYEKNPERMFELIECKMATPKERRALLEFLKFLNDLLVLRPGMFGLGVDLNKPLARFIAKHE